MSSSNSAECDIKHLYIHSHTYTCMHANLEPWTLKPPMLLSNMIAVTWGFPQVQMAVNTLALTGTEASISGQITLSSKHSATCATDNQRKDSRTHVAECTQTHTHTHTHTHTYTHTHTHMHTHMHTLLAQCHHRAMACLQFFDNKSVIQWNVFDRVILQPNTLSIIHLMRTEGVYTSKGIQLDKKTSTNNIDFQQLLMYVHISSC